MINTLDLERFKTIDITQRDNDLWKSKACFPSSSAIACDCLTNVKKPSEMQTADYIAQLCLNLSEKEKQEIINKNKSSWMFSDDFEPFQAIPIEEYVIKKYIYPKVWQAWRNQFSDIVDSIDRGIPVVALADMSSISYVGGHYETIVGYDTVKKTVITMDSWGNAHTNYEDHNGFAMEYDWSLFIREQGIYSYGLWFK